MQETTYDIIGDIHGQAAKLRALLELLGYDESTGVYAANGRKVIFLGDFIDPRADDPIADHDDVLGIVRSMVEQGTALAIMGNHEFNAVCFHTKHRERPTGYLRERSEKNIEQHARFLRDFENRQEERRSVIQWFSRLPLFLDLPQLRAIHACWDEARIERLRPLLTADNRPVDDFFVAASTHGSPEHDAVEVLLKGLELQLPPGASFRDKSGHERREVRVRWWSDEGETYRDIALVPEGEHENIPELPLPAEFARSRYPEDAPPLFVGHYWRTGAPEPFASNVACLDYSAGRNGPLVAYSLKPGERRLDLSGYTLAGGG